jgi:CBS domain-containing protein
MAKNVREVMTAGPRVLKASDPVVDAARLMRDDHVGSLPVVEGGRLMGMITDRDITTRVVAERADLETTEVGSVYTREPVTVAPDADLDEALRLMTRHQVRRLPVVEGDRLVGIVSQADIAREEKEKKTGELVEAISEPSEAERR